MKNYLNLFATVILIISILPACKKEKGCTDPYAANFSAYADENDGSCKYWTRSLQAKVDGTLIICDSSINVIKNTSIIYNVSGIQKDGKKFAMVFPIAPGLYIIPRPYSSFQCAINYKPDNYKNYYSDAGTITVTFCDSTRVKGSFIFSGVNYTTHDTVNVTEGIFDLQYAL